VKDWNAEILKWRYQAEALNDSRLRAIVRLVCANAARFSETLRSIRRAGWVRRRRSIDCRWMSEYSATIRAVLSGAVLAKMDGGRWCRG
jgi:hypothetical protein